MDRELLEQRKQMLTELVHDKAYVPMKAKEIAMLLNIPKAMRENYRKCWTNWFQKESLGSQKGKIWKTGDICCSWYLYRTCKRLWLCYSRRNGAGRIYP